MNTEDAAEKPNTKIDVDGEAQRALDCHTKVFGKTPLDVRLADIAEEADELFHYVSEQNLREETSDLLATVFCLCKEKGWKISDLIDENVAKLDERHANGWYLTHT